MVAFGHSAAASSMSSLSVRILAFLASLAVTVTACAAENAASNALNDVRVALSAVERRVLDDVEVAA